MQEKESPGGAHKGALLRQHFDAILTPGKDSCWIVTLGCDRLRPRSPLPAFGAMEQKTRLTALRTPSLPTPAELGVA